MQLFYDWLSFSNNQSDENTYAANQSDENTFDAAIVIDAKKPF